VSLESVISFKERHSRTQLNGLTTAMLSRMVTFSGGEAYLNQRVARFRPREGISPYYLLLALKRPIHFFDSTVVGTTVAHLSDEDLKSINIPVPDPEVSRLAMASFDQLFKLELSLRLRNVVLRKTRDLLLPKLISGELDVSDLDIKVEDDKL